MEKELLPIKKILFLMASALFLVCLLATPTISIASYSFTSLDFPGASSTNAYGIDGNNVVGFYHAGDGTGDYGFRYDGITWTSLNCPGALDTYATDISGDNIVGYAVDGFNTYGFIYNGPIWINLAFPFAYHTFAYGIDEGKVIGTYYNLSGEHGFTYKAGAWTSLDYPGAQATYAYGIEGNTIVGRYNMNGVSHGFKYDGTTWTSLDFPSSLDTYANGISDGNIVGNYHDTAGFPHAYIYDGTTWTPLDFPGSPDIYANGISGDKIVGYYGWMDGNEHRLSGFVAVNPLVQNTIRVPADFPTIQQAINASVDGDTVLVSSGIYMEKINFSGKAITVKSEGGPAVTTIDGNHTGTVVTFSSGESPMSVLEGFTVSNGKASFGAGIYIADSSSPTILGNIFEYNTQESGGFGAAIAGNESSPIIERNIFRNNSCDSQWLSGVVSFVNSSSPQILNNIFVGNPCRAINMTLPEGNMPHVSNNTIVGNLVGVRLDRRVNTALQLYRNNIIAENETGMEVDFGSESDNPTWQNNLVFNNITNYDGISDMTGINGNISVDPLFLNITNSDFHLHPDSPAIDAGDNAAFGLSSTDFDGYPRILDGNDDGIAIVDMGAHEFIRALIVKKSGTGSGTVTSSDGNINCGSDCSEIYNTITTLTLTAAQNTDSVFTGWTGCAPTLSDPNQCTVSIDRNIAVTGTFERDTFPPTGSIVINGGAEATKSTSATLTLTATDDSSVLIQMCISNTTNCPAYSWTSFASTKRWTLSYGNGTKTVYVWFKDKWGNTNSTPYSDKIILDTTAPANGSVTGTPGDGQVILNWTGFSDTLSGIGSYKVVFNTGSYAPYSCSSGTTIYTGADTTFTHIGRTNGTKYSYRVCAIDKAGNMSSGATRSVKPVPETNPPTGSIAISGGAEAIKSTSATLTLTAKDDGGNPIQMCISNTTSCSSYSWTAFTATKSWTLGYGNGNKTVYVWFRDKWGNATPTPYSDTIILDTTAPANGTVTGSPGDGQVTLNWTGFSDTLSGIGSYKVVFSTGSYPPYSCSGGTTIYTGADTTFTHAGRTNGTKYSYRVCAIDKAGNMSSGATRSVKPVP